MLTQQADTTITLTDHGDHLTGGAQLGDLWVYVVVQPQKGGHWCGPRTVVYSADAWCGGVLVASSDFHPTPYAAASSAFRRIVLTCECGNDITEWFDGACWWCAKEDN